MDGVLVHLLLLDAVVFAMTVCWRKVFSSVGCALYMTMSRVGSIDELL